MLDPLNAFALLPVSINGFLPQIFTLTVLHYYDLRSWYPLMLTYVSYLLNTIIFWPVVKYLNLIRGKGTALKARAYKSLGDIDSCGGMTGIALCLPFQHDSPPAFLIQQYGSVAWFGTRAAPWIWTWCTAVLLLLTLLQFRSTERKSWEKTYLGSIVDRIYLMFQSIVTYGVISVVFFAGMIYQAVMFHSYVALGLVELDTWSFGQIVAIAVWIPPVLDYLHLQAGESKEEATVNDKLTITDWILKRLHLARTQQPQQSSPAGGHKSPAAFNLSSWSAREQGYAPADELDDDAWRSSLRKDTNPENIEMFSKSRASTTRSDEIQP